MAHFLLFNLLIMLAFALPSPVLAGTPLNFGVTKPQTYDLVKTYVQSPVAETSMAEPDLNEDGVNELVIKHGCKDNSCKFSMFAADPPGVLFLGTITARDIQLSDAYTGSARNIDAFQSDTSDFKATEYAWDSVTTKYERKKEAKP